MPLPILPKSVYRTVTRVPRSADTENRSPFTGQSEVQFWGGEWWEYEIEFWTQSAACGKALSGFLSGLKGRTGKFLFREKGRETVASDYFLLDHNGLPLLDHNGLNLSGTVASFGNPVVMGAGQTGYDLITDGWTASATVLNQGDMIQLGADATARMHEVTADVASDGSGIATIPLWPSLRTAPADNDPIEITEPAVVLRLSQSVPIQRNYTGTYSVTVNAREAV